MPEIKHFPSGRVKPESACLQEFRGDPDFIAMWAGQGVGLMRRRAAADLVNDLVVESQRLLARLARD